MAKDQEYYIYPKEVVEDLFEIEKQPKAVKRLLKNPKASAVMQTANAYLSENVVAIVSRSELKKLIIDYYGQEEYDNVKARIRKFEQSQKEKE